MFGSYEDNIMILRRKIPQEREQTIIIGNKTIKLDVERVDFDINSIGEQHKIQNCDADKQ